MEREMRGMNKIVIVSQKTRLQELIERFNTKEQAQFYIEHMGDSFDDYMDEDRCYAESLTYVRKKAEQYARVSVIDKSFLCNYIFGRDDLVVCVGRDGLVCNTMKYLEESNLVIGINPDPSRWEGVISPFSAEDSRWLFAIIFDGLREVTTKKITFAHAVTQNGQELYAANDIFVGPANHISAGYDILYRGKYERQSSSGVIISTGLGQSSFAVREPYPSINSGADIVMGKIKLGESLKLRSCMPENGVIFSDGMQEDAISFNSGTLVTITVAKKQGNLLVCS